MKPRLDLEKSISKQRLSYKKTSLFFMNWFLNNAIWLFLLIMPMLLFINPKNNISILSLLIFVPFMLFLSCGLYLINTLVLIKGANLIDNRKRMIELIREKFPLLTINDTGQNIISCKRNTGLFNWGREITIIFNTSGILINATTLGRFNIKSPFHSVFNYIRMRELKKEF